MQSPATSSRPSAQLVQPEGISVEAVRQHLERVEYSDTFNGVEHQRRLLRYFVEQRLAGRNDQLTQSEIFGVALTAAALPGSKPGLLFPDEQAVRTHISRLRKTLLVYYRNEAGSEAFQIEIPMRKYIAVFAPTGRMPKEIPPEGPTPQSIEVLNRTGVSFYNNGQYAEAEPILKRALALRERMLGTDHPDTATSINNLATLYGKQGRYTEATPLLEQALEICERLLGRDHPETLVGVNNLGIAYFNQARYSDAEYLFNRALSSRDKLLGPDHPDTGTSLNNLAMLLEKRGLYAEAVPLLQRAVAIRERALGAEHMETASSIYNLSLLYKHLARFEEAAALGTRALEVCDKVLGAQHPLTVTIRSNQLL